jgi:hypothetical protein
MKSINDEMKEEIFKMVSTPGVELKDIAEKFNLDFDDLMKFLEEEYIKYDLNFGRRLCCRF